MFFQKEGRKLRRHLIPGNELFLNPIPRDEFVTFTSTEDPHAVEVLVGKLRKTRLGYVPRTHSQIVRKLIDEGALDHVQIYSVNTDADGYWRISMRLTYTRRKDDEDRVERLDTIMKAMQVPNRDYASLIAAATADGSLAEQEWLAVYNETCFET